MLDASTSPVSAANCTVICSILMPTVCARAPEPHPMPAVAAEIQRQIGEVNEMFQDLAVLIHDQGQQLQTVDMHISSVAERAREGTQELVTAERSQRGVRNKCLYLWLAAAMVVVIIMLVLFA